MTWLQGLASLSAGTVSPDEPLAPKTSVRAGGRAEAFFRPSSAEGLVCALRFVREQALALHVLGGGANTLVGDRGVQGVTVQLPSRLFPEEVHPDGRDLLVTLGAGAPIARLLVLMKAHRLTGAEFLAGIPGTLGGAVTMNAGTKAGECMSAVDAVEVATVEGLAWLPRAKIPVAYRESRLPSHSVITRVRFRLVPGDLERSRIQMEEDLAYRKRTQPLSLPNFGSVFRNPPGAYAGQLIEEAGLKGLTAGKAQVSAMHANWMVNLGGAAAADFDALIDEARRVVRERSGMVLHPEVKRAGVFL